MCLCLYAIERVCVTESVRMREGVCLFVCLCVWEREIEREKDRSSSAVVERERNSFCYWKRVSKRDRERVKVRECVRERD